MMHYRYLLSFVVIASGGVLSANGGAWPVKRVLSIASKTFKNEYHGIVFVLKQ
ncbi:MAG: hypothetical protein ABJC12_01325 [Saprospiraceae bacterium]